MHIEKLYIFETKLVKNAIFTVPIPTAKLSNETIKVNKIKLFSEIETREKNRLVMNTKKAPTINELNTPNFFINMPPRKTPIIEKISAAIFTTEPISVNEKPISR